MPPDAVHFSVTQLTTYLSCSRKYKFRYIERREPEYRSADLALGSAVHSAIEWWQTERIAGRSPVEADALRVFRADWCAQGAAGDLCFDGKDPEEMKILGEALVRLFVERFTPEPPPQAVEQRFEIDLPFVWVDGGITHPMVLVGYFDFALEGVVGEIKTTGRKAPPTDWILQLSAYSFASRTLSGVRPRMRVVELVKTKTPKVEVEEVTLTQRDEDWFLEVAREALASIQAGAFHPVPDTWACSRCEYRKACRGS